MKKKELVFIPCPGMGHLVSCIEMAKLLVSRENRLSITVLIINLPFDSNVDSNYINSLFTSSPSLSNRIKFINLPKPKKFFIETNNPILLTSSIIQNQKPHVRNIVQKLTSQNSPAESRPLLAGFVIDMFCTTMIDIANEFKVPSYLFFTSSAAYLGLVLHFQANEDNIDTEFDSTQVVSTPSCVNPVPTRVLPHGFMEKDATTVLFFKNVKRFKETKGILVNTFMELESHALRSISICDEEIPPVYPVGPIINLKFEECHVDITKWLNNQPLSSVVFLCFGSIGSFNEEQVKEIGYALEKTGVRFLLSLRKPPPKEKGNNWYLPSEYKEYEGILPEGFLDRTAEIGKVIGWAPQVAILGHPAIGGFVTHCGWNSILESIWFGVPMATWPLYAEQQFNAFELVIELGLALEIKIDYKMGLYGESPTMMRAQEIEKGINKLMEKESNEMRERVKQTSEKCRKAFMEGGSSYNSLNCFIQNVIGGQH